MRRNFDSKLRYLYMYMYVHIKLQQPLACISTKDGWCVHVHVQSYMYMYRKTCICVTTSEKMTTPRKYNCIHQTPVNSPS